MTKANIFFVAGSHGVGKGHFCRKLSSLIDGDHVTASSLIRKRRKMGVAKAISGIDQNQSILVEELNRYRTSRSCILLDGHFCLYNTKMDIEVLPIELYKALNLSYIVLLTCLPAIIFKRLNQRDGNKSGLSQGDIDRLQDEEIDHAHTIAHSLKIPITQLDVSDEEIVQRLNVLLTKLRGRYGL